MKKTFFLFVLLLSAMSMSAQSLLGTWRSYMNDDSGQRMQFNLTFANQKDVKVKVCVDYSDPQAGSMTIVVNMKGTYNRKFNQLDLNFNPQTADVSMENVKWNDEIQAALNASPEVKQMFDEMIKKVLQEAKKEVAGKDVMNGTMIIKSLTADKLVLYAEEDDETTTFTRVVTR